MLEEGIPEGLAVDDDELITGATGKEVGEIDLFDMKKKKKTKGNENLPQEFGFNNS